MTLKGGGDAAHAFQWSPYAGRPMAFVGVAAHGTWRLKQYTITTDGPVRAEAFAEAKQFAIDTLPSPACDVCRPGVGFMILHEGRDVRNFVLCWWDNENELPIHVWTQPTDATTPWRCSQEHESVCVWDLLIVEREREAYVKHVLTDPSEADIAGYLAHDASADQGDSSLLMKTECQRCAATLTHDGDAAICSFECTFCIPCALEMQRQCPNCAGELVDRPKRVHR